MNRSFDPIFSKWKKQPQPLSKEQEIIVLLLDDKLMHAEDISAQLAIRGYLNTKGLPFTRAQISSLLHSARQEERRRKHTYVESCGIDREKNPCGDASDY